MSQQQERYTTSAPEDQANTDHSHAKNVGRTAVISAEADAILDDIDTVLEEFEAGGNADTSLLDEMDSVLEENAEQVVANFVQKNGQ